MVAPMSIAECPVKVTVDVIGGKWKPLIVYFLKPGPQRFNALLRLLPEASRKVLTQQLKELELDHIVERTVLRQVPPHVEYHLTAHGRSLNGILLRMAAWGSEHRERYQRTRKHAGKGLSQ